MKRGTIDHPKTCALAQALGLPRYAAVGLLESLWHFTAQYAPQGDVGRWDDAAICHAVAWDRVPSELIGALLTTHWLDVDPDPAVRLLVHDWAEHSDRGVVNRLRARKLKFFVGGSNPGRTPHKVESNPGRTPGRTRVGLGTGTGTGSGSGSLSLSVPDSETEDPAKNGFAEFWATYPRRVKKQDADRAWQKLRPDAALQARIHAAIAWQRGSPDWVRDAGAYVPYPASYLNARRWEDEPPDIAPAGASSRTAGNMAAIARGLELVTHGR